MVGTRGAGSRSPMVGTTQARPCTGTTGGWCPQATTMSFCQKEAGATSRLLAVVGARTLAPTVGSPRQSCNLESQRQLKSFHSNSLKPVAIFLYPCRSINKSSTLYFPIVLMCILPSFLISHPIVCHTCAQHCIGATSHVKVFYEGWKPSGYKTKKP